MAISAERTWSDAPSLRGTGVDKAKASYRVQFTGMPKELAVATINRGWDTKPKLNLLEKRRYLILKIKDVNGNEVFIKVNKNSLLERLGIDKKTIKGKTDVTDIVKHRLDEIADAQKAKEAANQNLSENLNKGNELYFNKNYKDAFIYYKAAADQGSVEAMKNCAKIKKSNAEKEPNPALARQHRKEVRTYYRTAANLGDKEAMILLRGLLNQTSEQASSAGKL